MITSSGAMCDVCEHYILDPEDHVNLFRVEGLDEDLCCHDACKQAVLDAGQDWSKLPAGPLREVFERAVQEGQAVKALKEIVNDESTY